MIMMMINQSKSLNRCNYLKKRMKKKTIKQIGLSTPHVLNQHNKYGQNKKKEHQCVFIY